MNKNGIALILVVSILTVVAITVVSFIFTMRLESRAAANYLWQVKAGYLCEAGITHAKSILKEDKENDFIDTYTDIWRSLFSGGDIDNNDDREKDSRWIEVIQGGEVIGRYAVLVEDEAAKININSAGFHNESRLKATQGATPFEVSLKDFFSAKQILGAQNLSGKIMDYRYGQDKSAGENNTDDNQNLVFLSSDGVDNDADGNIDEPGEGEDEPEEFVLHYPYGDDRPFLITEEIKRIAQIGEDTYNQIKSEISAYSRTASVDRSRDLQWDINNVDAEQVLDIFLRSGVNSAWQKAANLVDFADSDFAQSTVTKSTAKFYVSNRGPNGDWMWEDDHYESKTYGGLKGMWSWVNIEAGEYFLIIHGTSSGQAIGDVTVNGLTQTHLRSGETFNIFPTGTVTISGSLTIAIQNNEPLGTTCYFKGIELCSAQGKALGASLEIKGAEGIRINEIMAKPQIQLFTSAEQSPGGDWFWQGGYYENTAADGGIEGEGTWLWQDIPDGKYYLTVFAQEEGRVVGDVKADGATQANMVSGEQFSERESVRVSGGKFRLDIRNNSGATCYFKSIILSQQPDAEYVELVNLTPNDVDLGGWSLDASGLDGWPASIPLGTVLKAGEYLILAVDQRDYCEGINNNGISFEDVWGRLPAVQLDFIRSVSNYSDMIEDAPKDGTGRIILRDNLGNIVDSQEYSSSQILPYISLEKGDPTAAGNVWFRSLDLSGATPAQKNNNDGIGEHELDEVVIKNRRLANLGEIGEVSSGNAWEKISITDLMAVCDRLTVYSLRLEAEGHKESGGWSENLRTPPETSWFISKNQGEVGTFFWDEQARIPNGVYTLYLYGKSDEAISVSLHLANDQWTAFTPALTPGANNGVCFGRIEIGTQSETSLPAHKLEMRIRNSSANNISHFDYIVLSPLPYVAGKLNINTASAEVLQALPLVDKQTAQRIVANRPYGNKEDKTRGIGDILSGNILDGDTDERIAKFGAISNLITVRSDTYQIIATGQALRRGRVMSEKRIRAVIQR